MQRFVNDPDYIVEDMVKGYVKAHKDLIKRSEANDRVVQYVNAPVEGKVGLVTGGGSGHLPLFLGYVGKGMIDGCAVGDVFQSPSVDQAIALTRDADQGAGVLYIYGNYNGDIFTFVQLIDHVDFKEAFQSLGGTYEKPTFQSKLAIYRSRKKAEQRKREEEKLRRKRELNNVLIDVYRDYMNKSEPFSDVWCDCCNALQYQLYLHEILNREEVRK